MARKIQIKRGNKANLPTLAQGELAYCQDEQGLYIGSSSGNKPVGGKAITPALIGAVNKAGDFMTGSLHATAFGINGNEAYASLGVNERYKGAAISTSDNTAEGCSLVVSTSFGVLFVNTNGIAYPVIHTGNFEQMTGLAMASIEE